MNKLSKITKYSTILGFTVVTFAFCYWISRIFQWSKFEPTGFSPIWHSTMPPPMSISPLILLLLGFLLLGFCGLRRKN